MTRQAYHEILGVSKDANIHEIRQAYKVLALKWHPDRHDVEDKVGATHNFIQVNSAYKALIRRLGSSQVTTPVSIQSDLRISAAFPPPSQAPSPQSASSLGSSPYSRVPSISSSSSPESIFTLQHSSLESSTTPPSSLKECACSGHANIKPGPLIVEHNERHFQPTSMWDNTSNQGTVGSATHDYPHILDFASAASASQAQVRSSARLKQQVTSPPIQKEPYKHPRRHVNRNYDDNGDTTPLGPADDLNLRTLDSSRKSFKMHGPPLVSLGIGSSNEWVYLLNLTLEELFNGKHCQFRVFRRLRSNNTKNLIVEFDIPPGCQRGTKILCRGVGHEWNDGTLQDVVFIVKDATHDRFSLHGHDLAIDIQIPWVDDMRQKGKNVRIQGVDGVQIQFNIDCFRNKFTKGTHIVRGAGMPVSGGGGSKRASLFVNWEIIPSPQSKISRFLRKILRFT